MLKIVYAFFVGILLAIFVGVGVSTFYPEPQAPETPAIYTRQDADPSEQTYKEQETAYQEAVKDHSDQVSVYNRNVSIIALVAAVIFLGTGLLLAHHLNILADGLVLGGVFTLVYSLGRGFLTDDNAYRFIIVSVGLVVAMLLGYVKFIKSEQKTTKKK